MDSKTKKEIFIATMLLIFMTVASFSLFYRANISKAADVNTPKAFQFKSGAYFCKIDIIDEGNTTVCKWDIGIAENNIKSGIIENESNGNYLEKFKSNINEISQKRFEAFLLILYLLFVLIVFISVQKDSQILKNESTKRFFKLLVSLLIILLIYKISFSFVELNRLYKDINFYFYFIS